VLLNWTKSLTLPLYVEICLVFAHQRQQETQLILTKHATHLCKCNGVADLGKTAPPHMCYHAEFGRSALNGVDVNTEELQNWGALELHSLGMGGVADPKMHAPPCQPRQIWWFCVKVCMRKYPVSQKTGHLKLIVSHNFCKY